MVAQAKAKVAMSTTDGKYWFPDGLVYFFSKIHIFDSLKLPIDSFPYI